VLPYRDLVENLDSGVPVFGLRAPGVDRETPPLGTVEELAAFYKEEIRQIQPRGPYRLGGYCFSGLVAYEMARQLQAQGETTSTLALLDTYPYRPPRPKATLAAGRVQLKNFKNADRAGRRKWMRDRVAALVARVHRAVYFKIGPRLYELLDARGLQRLVPHRPWNLVLIASNLAMQRYVPKPLDVRVEFFRAQRASDSSPTPWEGLATRGVDLRQIVAADINHERMMHEPYVQMLAEQLMRALDNAPATSQQGRSQLPFE
jgi:thioesterase domain-containing protein